MEVYLDNSATTRCYDDVAQLMTKVMCEEYGNPSSMHMKGVKAEQYIRYAKEAIAKRLKVNEKEIFFTSGGTESDNLAIIGCALANYRMGRHLITTRIEHSAVLHAMKHLEEEGFRVTYLPVDRKGCISLEDLKRAITRDTILVSIMHTNNEVGSIQPIEEAGNLIKKMNPRILFHVDAVQGFGKFQILPKKCNVDLLSVSSHKIHGPKGVGFLYVKDGVKIKPLIYGGGQQKGLRSGTENVSGVAGMAQAIEMIYADMDDEVERLYGLREAFVEGVEGIPDVKVNGMRGRRGAPHIVSVSIRGIRSEVMLHALEEKGIYVSAGSACSSNKPQKSATLMAMGIEKDLLDSTIRFSFSGFTTMEEINYTLEAMYDIIPMLRKYTRR